jgi:DNA-binding GntR family transcriptional regulator
MLGASSRRRVETESMNGMAYRRIKDKIIAVELPPASLIDEGSLAAEFQMGLTPVRQALRRLALENLVVILPRRGTIVADVNISDLHKIFEMRRELEPLAASLAAQRATPPQIAEMRELADQVREVITGQETDQKTDQLLRFDQRMHMGLWQAAHNEFLEETLERLYNHVLRLWNLSPIQTTSVQRAMEDHLTLFEVVARRDADQAAILMRGHVRSFQDQVLQMYTVGTWSPPQS